MQCTLLTHLCNKDFVCWNIGYGSYWTIQRIKSLYTERYICAKLIWIQLLFERNVSVQLNRPPLEVLPNQYGEIIRVLPRLLHREFSSRLNLLVPTHRDGNSLGNFILSITEICSGFEQFACKLRCHFHGKISSFNRRNIIPNQKCSEHVLTVRLVNYDEGNSFLSLGGVGR